MRSRLFRILSALAVISIALGAGVFAASPTIESTPIPAPPKPNFSTMHFLLGTWTCKVTSSRRPKAFTVTQAYSLDPTGMWINNKGVQEKTSWFPYEGASIDKITWDSDNHRWVDVYTDDFGGYGVTTSPGWTGNTAVWTDAFFTPGGGLVSESPTTISKVSDTKITSASTFNEKSGMTRTLTSVCNKSG